MPAERLTVFIVDDAASVRDSLALMLGLTGHRTALFADAEALLKAWRPEWAGCVVADLRLPGMPCAHAPRRRAR
jgi:FixJ family two-component response regulator